MFVAHCFVGHLLIYFGVFLRTDARADIEAETRERMVAQMAQMENKSLLEGWVAQMEEIDRLRGADPTDWAPDASSNHSESRARLLYDEIGAYNSRIEQLKVIKAASDIESTNLAVHLRLVRRV